MIFLQNSLSGCKFAGEHCLSVHCGIHLLIAADRNTIIMFILFQKAGGNSTKTNIPASLGDPDLLDFSELSGLSSQM